MNTGSGEPGVWSRGFPGPPVPYTLAPLPDEPSSPHSTGCFGGGRFASPPFFPTPDSRRDVPVARLAKRSYSLLPVVKSEATCPGGS